MARRLSDKLQADSGQIDGERGSVFAKRLIALEDEKAALGEDIKEIYRAAKFAGFPVPALHQYVKDMRADPEKLLAKRDYQEALEIALGPFMDTPLGQAAAARVVNLPTRRRPGRPPKNPQGEMRIEGEDGEPTPAA